MEMNVNDKSDKRDRRKRILISASAGCLLLLLYSMIFSFSAQDGEQSSGLSMYVAEKVRNTLPHTFCRFILTP